MSSKIKKTKLIHAYELYRLGANKEYSIAIIKKSKKEKIDYIHKKIILRITNKICFILLIYFIQIYRILIQQLLIIIF